MSVHVNKWFFKEIYYFIKFNNGWIMEDCHRQVQNWLHEIYGDERIPQYEIKERPLNLLYVLATKCRKLNNSSENVIEDLEAKTNEFRLERIRLSKLMNKIGLSASLRDSNSSQQSIQATVAAALELNLHNTELTNFVLGISELKMKEINVSRKLSNEKLASFKLLQKIKDSIQRLSSLKHDAEMVDQNASKVLQVANYEMQNTKFLRVKLGHYEKNYQAVKKKFSNFNMDRKIQHEELVKLSEEIDDLMDKHSALHVKIQSYQDFPADIHLAKLKLAEAKLELDRVEEKLLERIKPSALMD